MTWNAILPAILTVLLLTLVARVVRRFRLRTRQPLTVGAHHTTGALQLVQHVGALSDLDHVLPIPARHSRRRLDSPAVVH